MDSTMQLEKIMTSHNLLLAFIVSQVCTPLVGKHASGILVDGIIKHSYPRSTERDSFIGAIRDALIAIFPAYQNAEIAEVT
jgi:hypothetical protein